MGAGSISDIRRAQRDEHEQVRTQCGRKLTIGRLGLGDARHPLPRVFLDIGRTADDDQTGWAGLTVAEARQAARALLAQAAAAERDVGRADDLPGRVNVRNAGGDAHVITVRGHTLLVDQPRTEGGRDTAPTPTELLVASLASCVAFFAGRYLDRHGLDRSALTVSADFTLAGDRPSRVGAVQLRISAPGVPAERRDALLAVASRCTVHNTLRQQPDIRIDLD